MSTLQLSLATLGLVLIGLVLVYNFWQTRRNAPKKRRPVASGANEAEAASQRAEPVVEQLASQEEPPELSEPQFQPPHKQEIQPTHLPEPAPQPPLPPQPPPQPQTSNEPTALHSLIDALAIITLPQPTAGQLISQALPRTKRTGSKPFQVEGLNPQTQQWEPVQAERQYRQLQAGVQLANRLGALNEIEFSEFVQKTQTIGESLGASAVQLPDMVKEVARARELDQFAEAHDAQLSFMLRPSRAAWSTGYIDQQAQSHGFTPTSLPGRMILSSQEWLVLTLSFDPQAAQAEDLDRTAVYELTISLDVPQVPRELEPFERMRQIIQRLIHDMDAVLCDPSGTPVEVRQLEQMGRELARYYNVLSNHRLAAGSVLARRLFS